MTAGEPRHAIMPLSTMPAWSISRIRTAVVACHSGILGRSSRYV